MVCPQCMRPVSFWQRGLLTGLCPSCQPSPSEEVKARIDRIKASVFRVLCGAIAGLIGLAIIVEVWFTPIVYHPIVAVPFSSEGWRAGGAGIRGQMAHELVVPESPLMKKSPDEVRSILGVPDTEMFGGQTLRFRVDVGWRWTTEPALRDLVVRFDKGNEVCGVRIEPKYE